MCHNPKEDLYSCYPSAKIALASLPYNQCAAYPRIDIPLYTDYDPTLPGDSTSPSSSTSSSGTLYSPNSIYYENIHHGYSGAISVPLPVGTRDQ